MLFVVTFLFDAILAYLIDEKIYNLNKRFEDPEFSLGYAIQDPSFWVIIFAGFVSYIIWGLVFDFVMKEEAYASPGYLPYVIYGMNEAYGIYDDVSILINDPAVTRLWLLILFISNPLLCYYDISLPKISHDSRLHIYRIQDSFVTLLWNYLLYRHGYMGAVRIYSNLICIYLQMQRICRSINHKIRKRSDLQPINQILDQAIITENKINCNDTEI